MKYILYLTINIVTNDIYIGVHKTNTPYEFDGYYGNGIFRKSKLKHPKLPLARAIKKYGFSNFKRVTLYVSDSYQEVLQLEALLVNKNFLGRNDVYNITIGGSLPLEHNKIIYQYDSNGNYIKEFNSIKEAASKLHLTETSVGRAVNYKCLCGDYYFSTKKEETLDITSYSKKQSKIVFIYNNQGILIKTIDSMIKTAKYFNITLASVQRAILYKTSIKDCYVSLEEFTTFPFKQKESYKISKVYQYDANGNYIREYNSTIEATKELGLKYNYINRALCSKHKVAGFYWSLYKYDRLDNIKPYNTKSIGRYDKEGNLLEIFTTVRSARKQYPNVTKVLKGICNYCHGFVFKYINS